MAQILVDVSFRGLDLEAAAALFQTLKNDYVGPTPTLTVSKDAVVVEELHGESGFSDAAPKPLAEQAAAMAKQRKTRKTKKQPEPIGPSGDAGSPHVATAGESAAVTLDDVRAGLSAFNCKHGMERCRELLAKYQADRITSLKPEHYPEFVKECAA